MQLRVVLLTSQLSSISSFPLLKFVIYELQTGALKSTWHLIIVTSSNRKLVKHQAFVDKNWISLEMANQRHIQVKI